MIKYIELESLVNFIKNGCTRSLRNSLLDEHEITLEVRKFENYGIIFDHDIVISDNTIDIGKVDRVTIKEDYKIRLAILIFLHNNDLYDEYEINCTNLFNEEHNPRIIISKKFITKVKKQIEGGFKKIDDYTEDNDLLIIENHCEFCNSFEKCKKEILEKDKLQILPIFTLEDIECINKKSIGTLTELKNNIDILDDAHEFLQDKKDDITKFLQQFYDKEKKSCLLHKYYLNWNKYGGYNEYLVSFQGHSETDVVYAFTIKTLYSNDEDGEISKCKHIILKERPSNKKQVLEHYEEIIKSIFECINNNHKNGKDIIFYALAPYERKNFEKIIETLIEYQGQIGFLKELLFVSEYFGFNYYDQKEIKTYINPFATTWVDIKSLIEMYFAMDIPFKYTFGNTVKVFCENTVELNEVVLNGTFKMSWALKPMFINKIWDNNSEIKIESIINSRIYYLKSFIKNFKEKIKDNEIYPDKCSF